MFAALGRTRQREGGRAEPWRRRHDADRRRVRLRGRVHTGAPGSAWLAAHRGGAGCALFGVLTLTLTGQPGRHRPRADALRHRPLGLCRHGRYVARGARRHHPRPCWAVDSCRCWGRAVRPPPAGYLRAALLGRGALVPVSLARGPRAARGRRIAAIGARARLSGARIRFGAVLFGGAHVRAWPARYISLVYTPLWSENMTRAAAGSRSRWWCSPRGDRGACCWGALLFGGVTLAAVPGPGPACTCRPSCWRCCRMERRSWCCADLAQPDVIR